MSAQRRTTVKDKAPAQPPVNAAPAPASPAVRPVRDKAAADRNKAIAETRQSVIAVRTQAVRQLARDSMSEIKKVNWPDQQTTRNLTIVVIGISTFLGLTLGGIDFLLEKLFNLMT